MGRVVSGDIPHPDFPRRSDTRLRAGDCFTSCVFINCDFSYFFLVSDLSELLVRREPKTMGSAIVHGKRLYWPLRATVWPCGPQPALPVSATVFSRVDVSVPSHLGLSTRQRTPLVGSTLQG